MKSKVDKLDVDKLVPVPVDFSKLNDAAKIILLKKIYLILRWMILNTKCLILPKLSLICSYC